MSVASVQKLVRSEMPELSAVEYSRLGKVDPTDLSSSEVIRVLKFILCQCAGEGDSLQQSDVSTSEPLRCLGLSSIYMYVCMYVCVSMYSICMYVCMYEITLYPCIPYGCLYVCMYVFVYEITLYQCIP
jgi:hypothetical protein